MARFAKVGAETTEQNDMGHFSSIHRKFLVIFAVLAVTAACQTTSNKPGDPAHAWLNGTWNGKGGNWEQTFWLEVVNGSKVIGRMESCRIATGGCSDGPLEGTVTENTVRVTVQKSRTYEYTMEKDFDGNLINQGILLKKL